MRILIVTQIFLPEMGAQSNRLYPITRELVAAGHRVFVATGMPNYPEGVVFPAYRGKFFQREQIDGVEVLRTAHYTAPRNRAKWSQMGQYLSFIPAALCSGLRAGKIDVVLVTSPPLFSAIPAVFLAKLRRAALICDIRDLWPDEIVACGGASEESIAVRAVSRLERWAYRSATKISCTTQPFIDTIVARGVPRHKTLLIPNGADLELFHPLPAKNPIVEQYSFGDRFVVLYSGVLGIKHGLEMILEVARLLRDEKKIVFFLLGSGARREALTQLAQRLGLDNVIFGGQRQVHEIPQLLARADVCLSALLPHPYLEKIITVKVFEYLACEKPVVASLAGETARVLLESGGGLVVPQNDCRQMADAILSLYRDEATRKRMGRAGREYVEKNFSRSAWARRFEQEIISANGHKTSKASPLARLKALPRSWSRAH